MSRSGRVAVVLAALVLASPAYAEKPPSNPGGSGGSGSSGQSGQGQSGSSGTQGKPADTGKSNTQHPSSALPGPGATLATKAKAYGPYCQNQSKLHVAGQTGTPFSLCVTAMAKLATGEIKYAWTACSALSRRPVRGSKESPFSRCVVAGTRLLRDLHKPS